MSPRPVLKINGKTYAPTAADLARALSGWEPGEIRPGSWYVVVGVVPYPLREVVRRTLGLGWADFTSPHAHAFARWMGLEPLRAEGPYRHPGRPRRKDAGRPESS